MFPPASHSVFQNGDVFGLCFLLALLKIVFLENTLGTLYPEASLTLQVLPENCPISQGGRSLLFSDHPCHSWALQSPGETSRRRGSWPQD